jgi:hypothetical protein
MVCHLSGSIDSAKQDTKDIEKKLEDVDILDLKRKQSPVTKLRALWTSLYLHYYLILSLVLCMWVMQ